MKRSVKLYAWDIATITLLASLAGCPLMGCRVPSQGSGEAYVFYNSRSEVGAGHRNDGDKNNAKSEIELRVNALEDWMKSKIHAAAEGDTTPIPEPTTNAPKPN